MVERIEFGSRKAANDMRDRIPDHLAPSDSRVTKTVVLKTQTPRRIVERVESEAFGSRTSDRQSFGKAKLTESEKQSLRRGTNFDWQSHGFEAMSAKAALESKGVDTWQDYYEPGEGVDSSLSKLQTSKGRAQQSSASLGIEGMRTDESEQGNTGRRSRQAERAQSKRTKSAKRPALVEQDADATEFLREEQQFSDDVFDLGFSDSDAFGMPSATGRDAELLEERHEDRSPKAQAADEVRSAPNTRDPIKWSQNPDEYDFPGIDTIQPERVQSGRSDRAKAVDDSQKAPIADSPEQWASAPDEYDWPGIDTP